MADDHVVFTIRVDARVADDLRMLAFVIRPMQGIALRRYLTAVAGYVRGSLVGAAPVAHRDDRFCSIAITDRASNEANATR